MLRDYNVQTCPCISCLILRNEYVLLAYINNRSLLPANYFSFVKGFYRFPSRRSVVLVYTRLSLCARRVFTKIVFLVDHLSAFEVPWICFNLPVMYVLDIHEHARASEPVALSVVPLPVHPPATNGSGSTAKEERYRHVLGVKAINPHKDLVALVSRDLSPTSASNDASAEAQAGLAPPPPGISAAASQKLMRMRMIARAKALAAQKGLTSSSEATNSASSSVPKLTQAAPLRLSLWRMASVTGQQGERVWDIHLCVPNTFMDLEAESDKELEDISAEALTWSPDGEVLSVIIRVVRRFIGIRKQRQQRFVSLHSLQDGKQVHLVPLPKSSRGTQLSCASHLQWHATDVSLSDQNDGTALHLLSLLDPLPSLAQNKNDKDQKARNRQRMFHHMRDNRRQQNDNDSKAQDIQRTDGRGKGGVLLEYPRRFSLGSPSEDNKTEDRSGRAKATVLTFVDEDGIHALFNASFYLGCLPLPEGSQVHAADWGSLGNGVMTVRKNGPEVQFGAVHLCFTESSEKTMALLYLSELVSASYQLLTYGHDAIMAMREVYRNMHTDAIADWNRRNRTNTKKYATHMPSEYMILLTTGVANDVTMSILLGNDAGSENDLKKSRNSTASSLGRIEHLAIGLTQSIQRALVIFDEMVGCEQWHERFGEFFGDEKHPSAAQVLATIVTKLREMVQAALEVANLASQERTAWHHFYTWWMYERSKQESLRDEKGIQEPPESLSYNVVLLSSFIQRGFSNVKLEHLLGITMDAKTRGTEIEDDEEEEDTSGITPMHGAQSTTPSQRHVHTSLLSEGTSNDAIDLPSDHSPWYRNQQLAGHIAAVKEKLREPPKVRDQPKGAQQPPSPLDITYITLTSELHYGPTAGASKRPAQNGLEEVCLVDSLYEIVSGASSLFRDAFGRWMPRVSQVADDTQSVDLTDNPMLLRSEHLGSHATTPLSAEGSQISAPFEGPRGVLLRTTYNSVKREHLIGTVTQNEEGHVVLNIYKRNTPTHLHDQSVQVAKIDIGSADDAHIFDLQFYSSTEVVLLFHISSPTSDHSPLPDSLFLADNVLPLTVLASIRLDELTFDDVHNSAHFAQAVVPYRRAIRETGQLGHGATQLACNQTKDVCATMNEDGEVCTLVYWDMVEVEGDEEHEGDVRM